MIEKEPPRDVRTDIPGGCEPSNIKVDVINMAHNCAGFYWAIN